MVTSTLSERPEPREAVTPLLTAAEEQQLARLMRQGGAEGWAARERFIEANFGLVYKMARKYASLGKRYGLEFDDLVQEGRIGLIQAVDKFDPDLGYKFSTYATWWIKQALSRALDEGQSAIHVPVYLQERLHRLQRVEQRLLQDLGRQPTNAEIAPVIELSVAQIQHLRELRGLLAIRSLEELLGQEDEDWKTLGSLLPDREENTEEQAVEAASLAVLLDSLIDVLSAREREVLHLRYGFSGRSHTLDEVGKQLHVSRERIRQIEARALMKLRRPAVAQRFQIDEKGRPA